MLVPPDSQAPVYGYACQIYKVGTMASSSNEILDVCCAYLDLHTLARACAISKACKGLVSYTLKQSDGRLESRLIPAVTACTRPEQQEHYHNFAPLDWLLKHVGTDAVLGLSSQLAQISDVPLQCCKALIAAGARISWAQLVAAARSRVHGVETWVQAQQAAGVASDIPAIAAAICFPRAVLSSALIRQIEPQQLADVLHVAFNSTARHPIRHLQRWHHHGGSTSEEADAALAVLDFIQHAPRETPLQAVTVQRAGSGSEVRCRLVECQPAGQPAEQRTLQAALAQLPAAELDSLMLTALQRWHGKALSLLEKLPEAQLLPVSDVGAALLAALQDPACESETFLSMLKSRSARQLHAAQVTVLLRAGLQQQQQQQQHHRHHQQQEQQQQGTGTSAVWKFLHLCREYATAAIDSTQMGALLHAALQHTDTRPLKGLCRMKAATGEHIRAAAVAGLFDTAMQQQNLEAAQPLLDLLCSQQQTGALRTARIEAFCLAAVQQQNSTAFQYAFVDEGPGNKPLAEHVGAAAADAILAAARRWHSRSSVVDRLAHLSLLSCRSSVPAEHIMIVTTQQRHCPALVNPCRLAAQQLDEQQQLSEVLHAATLYSWNILKVQEAAREL